MFIADVLYYDTRNSNNVIHQIYSKYKGSDKLRMSIKFSFVSYVFHIKIDIKILVAIFLYSNGAQNSNNVIH